MKNNINIRKIVIWLVVIAVVSLTIATIAFFSTENYMVNFRDRNNFEGNSIDEVKTFGIDQLKEIYIHSVSSDVNVFSTDEEDVKIHFYGRSALKSEKALPKLITNLEGSKLKIEIEYPKVLFYCADVLLDIYIVLLDIYIPRDYRDNVIIDAVSAEVDISNLDINNFQCKTISGDLKIKSLGSDNLTLETTSGDVNIMDFKGNLKADSVSGDINVRYRVFDNNIDVKTISGKVKIDLPQNAEFYLKTNTVSGEVIAKFPITIISFNKMNQLEGTVGTGDNRIIIDTVSGDIYINK
jgi:lia operon protein LiaG